MDRDELALKLTLKLKHLAAELGFSLCGVSPAVEPAGLAKFDEWLAAGYAGQMLYLGDRREAYAHPGQVLEGARSVVMLAMPYHVDAVDCETASGEGRVSRYAWGGRGLSRFGSGTAAPTRRYFPGVGTRGDDARGGRYGSAVGAGVRSDGRPGVDW